MSKSVNKAVVSHDEHYAALDQLLSREGWAGEGWLRGFAADSKRIGEALGSLREDVSDEMGEHSQRMGLGFGGLAKLHGVLMCQAAARTLAEAIEPEDLMVLKGDLLTPRQCEIVRAGSRTFGQINDSEKSAFIAALNAHAGERLSLSPNERAMGLAQLMSRTDNFTESSRLMLIAALKGAVAPLECSSSEAALIANGPPYAPCPAPAVDQLLNYNHAPNDRLMDVAAHAMRRFGADPSARLESRFYGLFHAFFYDHAEFSHRYPHGVFDGLVLLLPVSAVSKGMGSPNVFESAMEGLSAAAREALGLEDNPSGVQRLEPGALHEALLSAGLFSAARNLTHNELQKDRVQKGFDAADVAGALRAACLEGLGFPHAEPDAPTAQTRLDRGLREAAWLGLEEKSKELLRSGANPKSASEEGATALMMAAAAGDARWVEALAPLSDPQALDRHGRSASDYGRLDPSGSRLAAWVAACAHSVMETGELLGATEPGLRANPAMGVRI